MINFRWQARYAHCVPFPFFFLPPFICELLVECQVESKHRAAEEAEERVSLWTVWIWAPPKLRFSFRVGVQFFFNLGFVHFLLFHNLRLYPPLPPSIPVFLSFSCTTWPPACHLCYFLELLREVRVSRRTEGNKDSEMNPSSIFVLRTSAPNLRGVSRLSGSGGKLQANQANQSSGTSWCLAYN